MNPTNLLDDETIRLENVSVMYRVPTERIGTFKEYMIRRIQGRVEHRDFMALKNVNLSVKRGEVFGLIGHNGAGKSTLLKLVARVLRPTQGRVLVRGRVAPLLELGAGFHPELNGRENIFLNGSLLGYTHQEMEKKYQGIVEFAELQEFINAPLRTYSSGMWARLGFAVATDVDPDVLIIDEILGVGDESFQRKSAARIKSFQKQGVTIFLVSHNMTAIESMCHRVPWLDHGEIRAVGAVDEVIQQYRENQPRLLAAEQPHNSVKQAFPLFRSQKFMLSFNPSF